MKQLLFVAAAGIVLTACVGTPKEEMTVAEGAEMECRSVYESGSILPKRVCNNKATWAAIEERDKEAAKDAINGVQSQRGYTPPKTAFGG
ncbi:MAG: hypothetical protein R3B94_07175 [Hyphomonas sp.]|jgi:hypothetical protein